MKKTHIVALVAIAATIGIMVSMTNDYSTYETFANAKANEGTEFHVIGKLDTVNGEMHYDPLTDPNYFSFYMTDDNGETKKVIYPGTKPRDFERSEQIVLIGSMEGEEFYASKILMKCPSKYVEDQVAIAEKATINE